MRVPIFDLRVEDKVLRSELLEAADNVLQHGRIMLGPEVQQFEEEVARYVGTRYAVGVDSGSSALYLALRSVGVGPGDEVITTPLTWIITLHAISACGAAPVCVDVREDFNIAPEAIEPAITKATKAIVPMHYSGQMCDMERICAIAAKHRLSVVEDAAQAFGAEYKSKKAGSFSRAGAFSMNSMKPFASYGEAGAIVTDEREIYEKLRMLRHAGTKSNPNTGITNEGSYVALNHKMDTIQAAMLLVALKRLPEKMARKNAIAERYNRGLSGIVKCPRVRGGDRHAYYTYVIWTERRDALRQYLMEHEVETKIFHEPLACDSTVYSSLRKLDTPMAYKAKAHTLSLPCHEKLSDAQVDFVIATIRNFFGVHKPSYQEIAHDN